MLSLVVTLIAFILAPAALAHDETRQPGALDGVTIDERFNARLPLDVALVDETGQSVTLGKYFDGKPVLLTFVYYDCPQLCPLVLEGLGRSLRVLRLTGNDYQVIAVSIDPAETPELAARKKHGSKAGPNWHFLTGGAEAIAALTEAAGVRYRAADQRSATSSAKKEFIHPANAIIITPAGKISRYFSAIDFPPRDLRFALIEASGNRIGSSLDRLLMLCYHYDPAQGRYTVAILNILRASAGVTMLVLGGFIGMMHWRERRTKTT